MTVENKLFSGYTLKLSLFSVIQCKSLAGLFTFLYFASKHLRILLVPV